MMKKSLNAVRDMIVRNGAKYCENLMSVADYLNTK
jgi:hypothetical protein